FAQHSDTVRETPKIDSVRHVTFVATHETPALPPVRRSIDLVLTGGDGIYWQGSSAPLQATANADFYARTSDLILTGGFHWGFSNPSTKGLDLGLRFPISESDDYRSGIYADAELLAVDNEDDLNGFNTGVRAAFAARSGWFEGRIAGEIRNFGSGFSAWTGVELGVVLGLAHEEVAEPTPKDSLRAALQYIATSQELKDLDKVTSDEELTQWLDRFWKTQSFAGLPPSEVQAQYMSRVAEANKKFGSLGHLGVSTDRGRVLLVYGEPDRIEAGTSTEVGSDRKFELWVDENRIKGYHVAFFLFLNSAYNNARGTYGWSGDYRQIYSNIPGEYSEGVQSLPSDLPPTMLNYIESFQ
ncbi:MAG TPA: GWxTD domain-containing protein, partial [Candidatus Kapabacteria bacterium]